MVKKKEKRKGERGKERSERNKPEKKGRGTERKNNEKSKEDLFLLLKNPLISLSASLPQSEVCKIGC